MTFLLVTSVLFVVAAPWVFRIYTVGRQGAATDDQIAVGTFLLRCFAPQVLFYGMAALFTALLNTRRRFFWPMAAPVLNNLVVIGVLLAVPHLNREPGPRGRAGRHGPAPLARPRHHRRRRRAGARAAGRS